MNAFPPFDQQKAALAFAGAKIRGGVCAALAQLAGLDSVFSWSMASYYRKYAENFNACLPASVADCASLDDFLTPPLRRAVEALTDKTYAQRIFGCLAIAVEGQISESPFRASYRSKRFSHHAGLAVRLLAALIRLYYYEPDTVTLLKCEHDFVAAGFECLIALEIRNGNADVRRLLKEAVYGDNSELHPTVRMIHGIFLSGDAALISDLEKLLLTAGLQEGLRQSILEGVDEASPAVLAHFLKLCLDENLFRFSSTTRAFLMWSRMGIDPSRLPKVKAYAELAYACLVDEKKRREYMESGNNVEAYFALWALGCYEIDDCMAAAEKLLSDDRHYRRILGWYFIANTDSETYKMQMACKHLDERDPEALAWIVPCLYRSHAPFMNVFTGAQKNYKRRKFPDPMLPDTAKKRRELFDKLEELVPVIGKKERKFKGNPFEHTEVSLSVSGVLVCMMDLAVYDLDEELIDRLLGLFAYMDGFEKDWFICTFLTPEAKQSHRDFLRKNLNDRSARSVILQRLSVCKLQREDVDAIVGCLRSKDGRFRKDLVDTLLKLPKSELTYAVAQLLAAKEEAQIQAGIGIIVSQREKLPELPGDNKDALYALRKRGLSEQTEILLDQLIPRTAELVYNAENGYGLYDPAKVEAFAAGIKSDSAGRGLFGRLRGNNELYSAGELKKLLPTEAELRKLCENVDAVVRRHADFEIETTDIAGRQQTILLGDCEELPLSSGTGCWGLKAPGAKLSMLPFAEEFIAAMGEGATDPVRAAMLYALYMTDDFASTWYESHVWYLPLSALEVPHALPKKLGDELGLRYRRMDELAGKLYTVIDPHEMFSAAFKLYRSYVALVGEEKLDREYKRRRENINVIFYGNPGGVEIEQYAVNCPLLELWRRLINDLELGDEDFKTWFLYEYRIEKLTENKTEAPMPMAAYFRACEMGLIPRDALTEYVFLGSERNMRSLTHPTWNGSEGQKIYDAYPWAKELVERVVDRAVSIEEKRGELATEVTYLCNAIERVEGTEHFCKLLAALGKDSFYRGYDWLYDTEKRAVLSRLLKHCYPGEGDTPEKLDALAENYNISEKRLAEAAMYAPQWAGVIEKVIGWPGLKCGVWFFHAHINENFSAEKETEVALWSPISPQQFNDGAFDKSWFFAAFNALGEKRFQVLYKSAKYITAGSNQHRRSQLYADAVLGRLDAEALKAEIIDKRNQEKLRCFPLIPIAEGDADEPLRRYEFIQKFLKESKQFGAQRRESEKKACATALENLAITTGVMDVNRLTWQMETKKTGELKAFFEKRELDGVTVWMSVDDSGTASVCMEKDGRLLKTAPKSLAKNAEFLDLKDAVKSLKEQKRRSRETLETAMINGTEFGKAELCSILENPVLAPMLKALLWVSDGEIGFPFVQDDALLLRTLDGVSPAGEALRLAHPHDLKNAGVWAEHMHHLYEQKITQPFKQVFREYYPLTDEERAERTVSRRYAGHQVQPKRTVALLRGRGWTVDYEEGLQKVFYKENLVVRMFALADWFSPADIEAPTLETVEFFRRDTGDAVALEEVPPVLFSETMRDIDLVVSVAHVGGVDPEASHSTVELRTALAKELTQLLGIANAEFIGNHARVHGKLAEWSVHLGSGVVHAEGVGMVFVLPVHSQHRGRIFLPFADDDPKTAEILSKILLLSEDTKIKDPTILGQLK